MPARCGSGRGQSTSTSRSSRTARSRWCWAGIASSRSRARRRTQLRSPRRLLVQSGAPGACRPEPTGCGAGRRSGGDTSRRLSIPRGLLPSRSFAGPWADSGDFPVAVHLAPAMHPICFLHGRSRRHHQTVGIPGRRSRLCMLSDHKEWRPPDDVAPSRFPAALVGRRQPGRPNYPGMGTPQCSSPPLPRAGNPRAGATLSHVVIAGLPVKFAGGCEPLRDRWRLYALTLAAGRGWC